MNQLKGLYICLIGIMFVNLLNFNLVNTEYSGIAMYLTVILFIIASFLYNNVSHLLNKEGNKRQKSNRTGMDEKKTYLFILIPVLISMLVGNSGLHTDFKSAVFAISALFLLYGGYSGIKQLIAMRTEKA